MLRIEFNACAWPLSSAFGSTASRVSMPAAYKDSFSHRLRQQMTRLEEDLRKQQVGLRRCRHCLYLFAVVMFEPRELRKGLVLCCEPVVPSLAWLAFRRARSYKQLGGMNIVYVVLAFWACVRGWIAGPANFLRVGAFRCLARLHAKKEACVACCTVSRALFRRTCS